MPETIHLHAAAPSGEWTVVEGEAIQGLDSPSPKVKQEAASILSKCLPPTAIEGKRTGIVVGYVQSGKTSSFTAVSALAKDNGYRLVVVVAGVSTNLFNQSVGRLREDLRDGWVVFTSDDLSERTHMGIASVLREWDDPDALEEDRRTILLCVMKQHVHLDKTLGLLGSIPLGGVAAIVIDDEADQASLNAKVKRNELTAIYRRLTDLREKLPLVTYVQYTATPQANLLIRLEDMLSPEFVQVLDAGAGYTGGQTFFVEKLGDLVEPISATDLASATADEAPSSLVDALSTFFLACAAYRLTPKEGRGDVNRSMMIHPSQLTKEQGSYHSFVVRAIKRWTDVFAGTAAPGEAEAMETQFRKSYDSLARTVGPGIPAFDKLFGQVRIAIAKTLLYEVNRSDNGAPNIRWDVQPFHILVGGQMLDRGYTVRGLCVTYMPRSGARGNIDTVQQRARWFGYKEAYLGYCRVWLTPDTRDSFAKIVEHEARMRADLKEWVGPLKGWKRRFIMAPGLSLTRSSVLGVPLVRGNYVDQWFQQTRPGVVAPYHRINESLVQALIDHVQADGGFAPFSTDPKLTDVQRHLVCRTVKLRWVLENFLLDYSAYYHEKDASKLLGVKMQISQYLENLKGAADDERVAVVLMSHKGDGNWQRRARTGESALHQGANARTNYPGDREIRARSGVTLQIFKMATEDSDPDARDAFAVAVYLPQETRLPWSASASQ